MLGAIFGPFGLLGTVSVHYNPANPERAVLETGAAGSGALLFMGIVFVAFGLLSFLF